MDFWITVASSLLRALGSSPFRVKVSQILAWGARGNMEVQPHVVGWVIGPRVKAGLRGQVGGIQLLGLGFWARVVCSQLQAHG